MKNKRESVHRLPLGTLLVFWLSCNHDREGSLVSAIPTGLVSIPGVHVELEGQPAQGIKVEEGESEFKASLVIL